MTASTQGAARAGEEYTPRVNNACASTSGRVERSRSRTPVRQRVRRAEHPIDASRLTTTTPPPRRIQAFPSEATSVSPVTKERNLEEQQELKQLLLEGWENGWLAMKPPACCARAGPPVAA